MSACSKACSMRRPCSFPKTQCPKRDDLHTAVSTFALARQAETYADEIGNRPSSLGINLDTFGACREIVMHAMSGEKDAFLGTLNGSAGKTVASAIRHHEGAGGRARPAWGHGVAVGRARRCARVAAAPGSSGRGASGAAEPPLAAALTAARVGLWGEVVSQLQTPLDMLQTGVDAVDPDGLPSEIAMQECNLRFQRADPPRQVELTRRQAVQLRMHPSELLAQVIQHGVVRFGHALAPHPWLTGASYRLACATPKAQPPPAAELERNVLRLRAALEAARGALDRLVLATHQADAPAVASDTGVGW